MKHVVLLLALFTSIQALAGPVPDIVFDIDQTIATMIHNVSHGDLLRDPTNPQKGVISIRWREAGVTHQESYRIYEGVSDLLSDLKEQQRSGKVRVSFFSGGQKERNEALLKQIKLSDGTSALDLVTASDGSVRSFDRSHMTPTGLGENARIRERFKKDLTLINSNLDNIVLVDDIQNFVPDHQKRNVLWLGENFPYPERVYSPVTPDKLTLKRERNKIYWVSDVLNEAIEKHHQGNIPLAKTIERVSATPFSMNQENRYLKGKLGLLRRQGRCHPKAVLEAVKNLY